MAYDVAEGPTKVDFGESDDQAAMPEADVANGKKFSGWTNPLGWTDSGEDDESVLLGIRNQKSAKDLMLINLKKPDNLDGDPDTVSDYDAHKNPTEHKPSLENFLQKPTKTRDEFDLDPDTVSGVETHVVKKMPLYGSFVQTDAEIN